MKRKLLVYLKYPNTLDVGQSFSEREKVYSDNLILFLMHSSAVYPRVAGKTKFQLSAGSG